MPHTALGPPDQDLTDLEDDLDFRQEVIEDTLAKARQVGLIPGKRIERVLAAYVAGELTFDEMQREVMRPFVH